MKRILTQFFGKSKQEKALGVNAAVVMTPTVPTKEVVGTVSEELRLQFVAAQEKQAGIEAALIELSHALGKLRVEESDKWNAVYAELGVERDSDETLSINRKTGVVTRIIPPEES